MSIIPKYFLTNPDEQKEKLEGNYIDIFFIYEQKDIDRVDFFLCKFLHKRIGSNVYWYMSGEKAVVCVMEKDVKAAIEIGRQLIIKHFDSMSIEYQNVTGRTSVLDDFSVIATFTRCSVVELNLLCSKIDDTLLIKINSDGLICVLKKHPFGSISTIHLPARKLIAPKT